MRAYAFWGFRLGREGVLEGILGDVSTGQSNLAGLGSRL